MNKELRFIVTGAVIAAMYACITLFLAPLSYGQVQFRVSEILTVLPYLTPAAIPGLFVGCILGNIMSPMGPVDMIIGSVATLIGALLTRHMPNKYLAPLPPVIANAVIVGLELHFMAGLPLLPSMLYVGLGEAVVCYVGGLPLLAALEKLDKKFYKV